MQLTKNQLAVISCCLALQAFILVVLNAFIPILAGADHIWVAFQAWAVYFLAGCSAKGGVKAFIGYATGIAASIAIIELIGVLSFLPSPAGINLAMALAVFIVVIPAIMSEAFKNMVPALFIGSGAFFGLSGLMGAEGWSGHLAVARVELVYCAVGLLFGYITVFWRGKYEASLSKKEDSQ
ncbi:MAG: DUF1097 domain-containing protein [Planctomycetaceae bacterium]|nr:DUF1097 domain-containing protein [Planctomycetaceae bacterium]